MKKIIAGCVSLTRDDVSKKRDDVLSLGLDCFSLNSRLVAVYKDAKLTLEGISQERDALLNLNLDIHTEEYALSALYAGAGSIWTTDDLKNERSFISSLDSDPDYQAVLLTGLYNGTGTGFSSEDVEKERNLIMDSDLECNTMVDLFCGLYKKEGSLLKEDDLNREIVAIIDSELPEKNKAEVLLVLGQRFGNNWNFPYIAESILNSSSLGSKDRGALLLEIYSTDMSWSRPRFKLTRNENPDESNRILTASISDRDKICILKKLYEKLVVSTYEEFESERNTFCTSELCADSKSELLFDFYHSYRSNFAMFSPDQKETEKAFISTSVMRDSYKKAILDYLEPKT